MEAVGRLAGGVAHDFNNLLTIVLGRSQMLLQRMSADDPLRRQVKLIQQTGQRASALTQQLLAFSRRQVLQPRVLQLDSVVSGMEKMLHRLIGEDVELVIRPDTGPGWVEADPGQLEQVIMNLAVNARDAMPRGGRLTIETASVELESTVAEQHAGARPGRFERLVVTDTGSGMDAETRAHLFEPFFTTKGPGQGTGLGLATVYGIVSQSSGFVWVDSEPGRGATFTIHLPSVAAPAETIAPGPADPEAPRGSETVLLVEDEEDLRDMTHEILESHGYRVLTARHGGEALSISERHRGVIDLLLTDVVMPQMSGPVLAESLRARHAGLRVLYMSGYTADAIGRHGVLEAGLALLHKPFTPDALTRKVRELLDAPGPPPAG